MLLLTEKIKKIMEKHKTAVEWLKHQLSSFLKEDDEVFNLIQQALELEKQQRIDDYNEGYHDGINKYYNKILLNKLTTNENI